jgi:hypothetical protein
LTNLNLDKVATLGLANSFENTLSHCCHRRPLRLETTLVQSSQQCCRALSYPNMLGFNEGHPCGVPSSYGFSKVHGKTAARHTSDEFVAFLHSGHSAMQAQARDPYYSGQLIRAQNGEGGRLSPTASECKATFHTHLFVLVKSRSNSGLPD